MDDSLLVGVGEAGCDPSPPWPPLRERDDLCREDAVQIAALDELHDDVVQDGAAYRLLTYIVDRDDVGVIEPRVHAGFVVEPGGGVPVVRGDLGQDRLDCDTP